MSVKTTDIKTIVDLQYKIVKTQEGNTSNLKELIDNLNKAELSSTNIKHIQEDIREIKENIKNIDVYKSKIDMVVKIGYTLLITLLGSVLMAVLQLIGVK